MQIFFLMSSFLLGIKYKNISVKKTFILKRWEKISCTYYPFLIISLIIMCFLGVPLSVETVLSHFLYLNYFVQERIEGVSFGHLWYISMQMLCYAFVFLLGRRSMICFIRKLRMKHFLFLLIFFYVLLFFIVNRTSIPSRIFIVLFSYYVIFVRADEICNFVNHVNDFVENRMEMWKRKGLNFLFLFCFFLLNFLTLYLFCCNNLNEKILLRDSLIFITSVSWFFVFLLFCRNKRNGIFVSFVSGISFDLYLVHHPFILGNYSLIKSDVFLNNIYANGVITVIGVVLLAYFLNVLSHNIRTYIEEAKFLQC